MHDAATQDFLKRSPLSYPACARQRKFLACLLTFAQNVCLPPGMRPITGNDYDYDYDCSLITGTDYANKPSIVIMIMNICLDYNYDYTSSITSREN